MHAAAMARDHSRSRVVPFFIHHQSRLQCAPMKYEPAVRPSSQTFVKRDYPGRFSRKIGNLQSLFKIVSQN